MSTQTILLFGDCKKDSSGLKNALQGGQYRVVSVGDMDSVLSSLEEEQIDLVMLHPQSFADCHSLLDHLSELTETIPVVFAAENPSIQEARLALRSGVSDYLEPPFEPVVLMKLLGDILVDNGGPTVATKTQPPRGGKGFARIVGNSVKMEQVYSLITRVCDADTTVLVHGESGTGKELIAQALHYEGARRKGPFIPVNCGAIPAELLESELFGHEKGAFTHAVRTRTGRFELADGGTVFLDEISEMSPMLQVKILRVLQERQFERIGGTKTIKSNFRIIAATNKDLDEEVREGRFRQDLYYRLNVIPIEAPPLRERISDIPLLVDYFNDKFRKLQHKTTIDITPEAMEYLMRYPWPGNVRELENMVERMVILTLGDTITIKDLPERLLASEGPTGHVVEEIPAEGFSLSKTVAEFEKKLIVQALDQTNWVKNRAAKLLNVNRTTLIEKMKRYRMPAPPGKT